MPLEDFYRPQDPDALRRENELLALENGFLRGCLGKREEEAGSMWVRVKRFEELQGAEEELREREIELARLQESNAHARRQLEAIAASRSWRLGHRLVKLGRLLTLRRSRRPDFDDLTVMRALSSADGGSPDREAASRRAFKWSYSGVARLEQQLGEREDADYSLQIDGLGVLAEEGTWGSTGVAVDVVVCVHNALPDVRRCLWSLLAAGGHPLHLILVDDGSDQETTSFLSWFAAQHPTVEQIENRDPPHGYTVAADLGMRASTADYVVLLNSDTVVTPGWLDELIEVGESDEALGILGPLSNAASHQSVPEVKAGQAWATNPLPSWLTPAGMAYVVRAASEGLTPRVPFVNGFCYVIKRSVIEAIGYFDETRFAEGFSEENDYSVRALDAGFSLAIADRAYVYHAKSRSYGSGRRNTVARGNYQRFLRKHGEARISTLLSQLNSEEALSGLRFRLREMLKDPESFALAFRSLVPDPLDVTFVLPGMSVGSGGGVHSIYQEARGMLGLGIPARVALPAAHLERALAAYRDAADVFQTYSTEEELADLTARSDVVVATHHRSVSTIARMHHQRQDFLPAYYVQDYEPFFFHSSSDRAGEAVRSYEAMKGELMFAKTHWLCSVIAGLHRLHVVKVQPSIDHDVYHDRGREISTSQERPMRFAAMVRPRSQRRQPLATYRLLARLKREFGADVEAVSFGCSDEELETLCGASPEPEVEHRGLLTREQVAQTLRESDVFLDASVYQAFGRTGLEAMACGCTSILPRTGGAAEYARDGENALLVDTLDLEATYAAMAGLARNPGRLAPLQANALLTAKRYSVMGAALSEYVLFAVAHRLRVGRGRASQVGA
jgi:GT2 family glycosyltransferase/glycosyltransferase involved in cell wall biosynthesis